MQTRLQSLIESAANIAAGLVVSISSNFLLFPLFGWSISMRQNLVLGVWMTGISLVRSYVLRRCFNRWHR